MNFFENLTPELINNYINEAQKDIENGDSIVLNCEDSNIELDDLFE